MTLGNLNSMLYIVQNNKKSCDFEYIFLNGVDVPLAIVWPARYLIWHTRINKTNHV